MLGKIHTDSSAVRVSIPSLLIDRKRSFWGNHFDESWHAGFQMEKLVSELASAAFRILRHICVFSWIRVIFEDFDAFTSAGFVL